MLLQLLYFYHNIYVKLLFIAWRVLFPTHLLNSQGETIKTVFAYNPSIQFFHAEHLPLALLSIIVLLTFSAVPPIVLIFYQATFFQKCLTRCKMNTQALRTFVETFQGCYKDGTNGTRLIAVHICHFPLIYNCLYIHNQVYIMG
jgi:hypothetical protein